MPSLRACIADFGLCTLTQHAGVRYTSSSSLGAGALLYRAPELLNRSEDERKHGGGNEYGEWMTLASDVYSFGCICYEVLLDLLWKINVNGAFVYYSCSPVAHASIT